MITIKADQFSPYDGAAPEARNSSLATLRLSSTFCNEDRASCRDHEQTGEKMYKTPLLRGQPPQSGLELSWTLAVRWAFDATRLAGCSSKAAARVSCVWLFLGLPAQANNVDVAIVFAVDYSASVDSRVADIQREGHATALTSPEILSAISGNYLGCIGITYVEWSSPGKARVVLPWKSICGPDDARAAATVIRTMGDTGYVRRARSGTSISSAIDVGSLLLDEFPGKAARKIIDISANGKNNDGLPVGPSRLRAIAKGYTINGIAIAAEDADPGEPLTTYFSDNVIGGSYAFVMGPAGASDYVTALRRKLVTEISLNIGPQFQREN